MGNSESRRRAASIRHRRIAAKASFFPPEQGRTQFVADVMLGRLAKWLRLAGFDVIYSNKFSDDELVKISNSQGRILLSQDTHLLVRKEVRSFIFIENQDLPSQVRQVFKTMKIVGLSSPLTRCLSCNVALQDTARDSVRSVVPEFVYRTQTHFKSCPGCGKVFWAGSHRTAMILALEQLLK